MPFVCTLLTEDELEYTLAENGSDFVGTVCCGYDMSTDYKFDAMATLSPLPGGIYEHTFCVIRSGPIDGFLLYHDGADTKYWIPDLSHRAAIFGMLCKLTEELIDAVSPQLVIHSTYVANLPPKALTKHEGMIDIFRSRGYTIHREPPHNGRHSWQMERLS